MEIKICTKCNTGFPNTEQYFYKDISCKNGLRPECKKCRYKYEKESRLTRIYATKKLLNYCPEFPPWVIYNPKELVILRDSKGKLKDYKDTIETRRIRSVLKKANHINNQADILFNNRKISMSLQAIFKEKFTLYGRLHTSGYRHIQGFSEEERKEITINGDPVVELDLICEYIFNKNGYDEIKPESIKNSQMGATTTNRY